MSKKDNSPHVAQREKLKDEFDIRKLKWTPKQEQIIEANDAFARMQRLAGLRK